jgi:hypothetical protein
MFGVRGVNVGVQPVGAPVGAIYAAVRHDKFLFVCHSYEELASGISHGVVRIRDTARYVRATGGGVADDVLLRCTRVLVKVPRQYCVFVALH